MKWLACIVVLVCLSVPASASAQEVAVEKGNRGKTTLIGLAVGAGAALIYGLSTDYCTNPVGEYLEHERAVFCGLPIVGMVAGGAIAGYFIGHGDRPAQHARQTPLSDKARTEAALQSVVVRLRAPESPLRHDDKLYRHLWRRESTVE